MAGHYAQLKSPALLQAHMTYKGHNCASLARVASYERLRNGSSKGVSRQFISKLVRGEMHSCEPDLAAAIERVLDVPDHMIFSVLSKSRDTGGTGNRQGTRVA